MQILEIIGRKRANLGKTTAKQMRREAVVPCVLYGAKVEQVFFAVDMIMFKNLVYTPKVHQVDLNIEGTHYKAILQEVQYHPVSEVILHADFLVVSDDKPVKMEIPIKMTGASPGVQKGGKLLTKVQRLKVSALAKDMPDFIEVSVADLDLNKSIKVGDLKTNGYVILNSPLVTIASVVLTRALKSAAGAPGGK
jgi:large subunit ribosomal protein L25